MQRKLVLFASCVAVVLCAFARQSVGQDQAQQESTKPRLHRYFWAKPAPNPIDVDTLASLAASSPTQTLPLTTFFVDSSRDGNHYRGVLVGKDPFNGGGSVSVPTYIVPLIIRTHQIGPSVDPKTGIISTTSGIRTFDPTVADTACLTSPNNVPLTLFEQSPIFKPATFSFGGTVVGKTQYVDAFQRANFWKVDDHDTYHVRLGPVKTLAPIVIDAPAVYGLALSRSALGPPASCAPLGIININWFDPFVTNTLIPALAAQGVNPSTFPIFLVHNVVWAGTVTNFDTCCAIGYHGAAGVPLPIQTYSPLDFDSTGLFGTDFKDVDTASHEVAEWMNDPFALNPTPLWGHVGQVAACQGDLEVGDPLSFSQSLRIAMPNGFTYHLQELAFFSWFFGAPSVGVNGWFSNNATFLTDAGPPCQ
jgi:chitinase